MTLTRLFIIVLTLSALTALVHELGADAVDPLAESTLALGFILLFAFSLGQLALKLKAPKITGYLAAGVIIGPFGLGFVSHEGAAPLQLVNGLALSLIAFTAGGELKISRFRPRLKALGFTAAAQFIYTFSFVFALLLPMLYVTRLLGDSFATAFYGAVLLGVISTANSPATAIAVITETKSSGPVSDIIMGVTVLKDVIVVVIFAIALGFAGAAAGGSGGVGLNLAFDVFYEIAVSLAAGCVVGALMTGYLKITGQNIALFVVGAALVVVEVCISLGIGVLLVSIMAGFIVENFSKTGEKLIKGIEASSAPIYVIFFSLAGQGLDLNAFADMWPYAAVLVLARMAGARQGTIEGIRRAEEPVSVGKSAWTGFVGQAGVSIGFAVIVGQQIPGWGAKISALVLACIVINQMAGPVMMKRSLILAGETAPEPERNAKAPNLDRERQA